MGLINLGLMQLTGPRVPGMVFLLAVVLLALKVGRGPVLLAGALSALGWNFFFLPPRFTFVIAKHRGRHSVLSSISSWPSCSANSSRASARRNKPNADAKNAPPHSIELTRELAEADFAR